MAIGDAADAAGMDTLAGTEDLRDTYIEHNRTRDYLANHQTAGTHSAAQITTGTLDDARLPVIPVAKIPSGISTSKIGGGVWSAAVATSSDVDVVSPGRLTTDAAYGDSVAGHGGFRTLNVALDGTVGGLTSSRRFKQNIEAAAIPREALRALRVVFFTYRADERAPGYEAPLQLGLIAEEVHDLGLTWLVEYDDKGRPHALAMHMLPFVALLLAQDAQDRADELAARLDALTGGAK